MSKPSGWKAVGPEGCLDGRRQLGHTLGMLRFRRDYEADGAGILCPGAYLKKLGHTQDRYSYSYTLEDTPDIYWGTVGEYTLTSSLSCLSIILISERC
jgi:hypothetical protein